MGGLEWREAFSVGHASLDAEHRSLIDRVNRLCRALDAREPVHLWTRELDGLIRITKEHFDHELAVLNDVTSRAGTPQGAKSVAETAVREHGAAHDLALHDLKSIAANITRSVPDDMSRHCEALVRWFIDHSVKYDADLKAVFQAM